MQEIDLVCFLFIVTFALNKAASVKPKETLDIFLSERALFLF